MSDILAAIDNALTDYGVSDDAMRWVPVWDEPVVQPPGTLTEWLMLRRGLDGYAATALADQTLTRITANLRDVVARQRAAVVRMTEVLAQVTQQVNRNRIVSQLNEALSRVPPEGRQL